MLAVTQLVGFVGRRLYATKGVNFDGSNDYMLRGGGLTGAADGKVGTASLWIKMNGGDGGDQRIFEGDVAGPVPRFIIYRFSDNKLNVFARNASGTTIMDFKSSTSIVAASGWKHALISWDLAAAALQLYVDDANDSPTITTNTNDTIDYTLVDWAVGALTDGTGKLNADIADLYVNLGTRLDLSVEANRRKFISAAKKPVDLGQKGELPTGAQPICFFKGPASAFNTNIGSGGNFTVTGALTDSTSSPSG